MLLLPRAFGRMLPKIDVYFTARCSISQFFRICELLPHFLPHVHFWQWMILVRVPPLHPLDRCDHFTDASKMVLRVEPGSSQSTKFCYNSKESMHHRTI